MASSEPYTLLESIFIRLQELKDSGVPVEQRFPELKSHIVDLLDVVKDYQLLTLDQFIHAAFIAANNVQDVRLYSLEARLDALKNAKVGLGQILFEILIIAATDIAVVAVGGELLIAAVPAVGALMYRMRQNKRVIAQIGEEVASIEKAVVRRRAPMHDIVRSWEDRRPPPLDLYFRSETEEFVITYVIKSVDEPAARDAAMRPAIEAIARDRAERALRVSAGMRQGELSKSYQDLYQRYRDLRGPDTLSSSLRALADHVIANAGRDASGTPATDANKLTPSSAITELVSELQRMKISIINEAAYSKSVIRKYPEESTFFVDLDVANVLIELEDLYPRLIYAYDALLSGTHHLADRVEIGIWYVYLKANTMLWIRDVADEIAPGSDGVFYNQSTLATQKPTVLRIGREVAFLKITGHDFTGIKKLTDQQAQYLFGKFARAEIEEIRQFVSSYEIGAAESMEELIHADLASAVDLPETNRLGFRDSQRDRQVRILKLCVIVFFLRLEERLSVQEIKSPQFGAEMVGQPFKNVLDLLKPPEPKESPPPSTEAPADDPLQQALKDLGFQTKDDVTPELLLLQTELRLVKLRLPADEKSDWRLPRRQMCEEIRELLSQLQSLELTSEQKEKELELEQEYAESVCNRTT